MTGKCVTALLFQRQLFNYTFVAFSIDLEMISRSFLFYLFSTTGVQISLKSVSNCVQTLCNNSQDFGRFHRKLLFIRYSTIQWLVIVGVFQSKVLCKVNCLNVNVIVGKLVFAIRTEFVIT